MPTFISSWQYVCTHICKCGILSDGTQPTDVVKNKWLPKMFVWHTTRGPIREYCLFNIKRGRISCTRSVGPRRRRRQQCHFFARLYKHIHNFMVVLHMDKMSAEVLKIQILNISNQKYLTSVLKIVSINCQNLLQSSGRYTINDIIQASPL